MQTGWELQLEARAPGSPWAVLSGRMGGDARVLGAFALLYALLVTAALLPREPVGDVVIVWPAAGLLLLALWLSDRRFWPVLLLLQFGLELLCGVVLRGLPAPLLTAAFAHTLGGLVGAVIVRRMLGGPQGVRVVALLLFACAAVVGAAAGSLLQTLVALATGSGADLPRHLLLWWLSDLLGTLITLPVLMSWLVTYRFAQSFPPLSGRQRVELVAVTLVQGLVVALVFADGGAQQVRFPVLIVFGLIYGAARLPPRWNTAVLGGTCLLALWLIARGGNPLGIQDPVTRVLWGQCSILVFVLVLVGLSMFIAQSRVAVQELAASQARYRSFFRMSSEAVWRVELDEPMPVELPAPAQIEWLRRFARVAESSASFGRIAGASGWVADAPWVQVFEANLPQILQHNYNAGDLRFTASAGGRTRTFLTAFNGVVRNGRLERIWGVARDVTELLDLNARLLREQELLRSYAQRITGAEEGVRRSTAVELHNGIGQELVAMGMLLTVMGNQLPAEQRAQLDEFRGRLHRVQQRTRDMISDLSPPGLYDLGLMPALQWLVVYLRGRESLRIELEGQVEESAVSTELRVLVFKLVREMLRNVVKHSGVDAARVSIRGDRARLLVEVRDAGRGFAWDRDSLANPQRGFGLWSIANRVAELGGMFGVDSAPGSGARFSIEIPLRRA